MRIYKVSTYAKPPGGRFKYYAPLNCKESDSSLLDDDMFEGRPYPKKWRKVELFFDHPNWPRADFYNLSIGKFVCNAKARKLCGPALEEDGEFLPVTIEGEQGVYFVYNVVCSGPFLDSEKSIWQYYEPKERRDQLVAPAFISARLGEHKMFKVPEDYFCKIYSVERSGKADDGEFKSLVEEHKLTGLAFELVWSEYKGPLKPKDYFVSRGYKLRTGDGKLVKWRCNRMYR